MSTTAGPTLVTRSMSAPRPTSETGGTTTTGLEATTVPGTTIVPGITIAPAPTTRVPETRTRTSARVVREPATSLPISDRRRRGGARLRAAGMWVGRPNAAAAGGIARWEDTAADRAPVPRAVAVGRRWEPAGAAAAGGAERPGERPMRISSL